MEKLYKEIDNKDGSITLAPKDPNFGKIFPFGEQESWDEIFDEFAQFGKGKIGDWLKKNFKTPERL